jgi:glycosyltransferase involved in cell wall biosynthesis
LSQRYDKPTISVITVTYNAEKTLENTILSVINQTFGDIEYIIVDGGSTDSTLDIIRKYEKKISFWISESDAGIYDAMNKGIKMANGVWINFMNSGDLFVGCNVLRNVFSAEYPDSVKFLYSDFYIRYEDDVDGDFYTADYDRGYVLHQSVIYKKELHDEYGYYLVTNKIIISDYLFFNAVNNNFIKKIETPISINAWGGISSNPWNYKQKICADYIFGKISFCKIFILFILHSFRQIIKRLFGKFMRKKIHRIYIRIVQRFLLPKIPKKPKRD